MSERPIDDPADVAPDGDKQSSPSRPQDRSDNDAITHKAIEKLSERRPEVVSELMAIMGQSGVGNPLHSKLDANHITALLEIAADHDEREYELHKTAQSNNANESRSNRRYLFAVFCVVVALFVVILLVFQNKPEVLIPCLTGLGGMTTGFLAGWGIGQRKT